MELDIKNHIDINIQNNMPCGSYIVRDGKLIPNLDDEAMKHRSVIASLPAEGGQAKQSDEDSASARG